MKLLALLLNAALILSCSQRPKWAGLKKSIDGRPELPPGTMPAAGETGDVAASDPGLEIVWKRYRAFENGLKNGLSLEPSSLCAELGKVSCIDNAHLTFLGGNEPYQSGLYERAQTPTVLSAVAVDRIVLSACSSRLEQDRAAGAAALVFKYFPLSGASPTAKQLEEQATDLYRRFLARDPETSELAALQAILEKKMANDKLALMVCYAIGSSVENILL